MPDITELPPLRRLAEHVLKRRGGLEPFVRDRRAAGRSWRLISRDVWDVTQVDVSYEALRQWFPDDAKSGAA